MLLKNMFLLLQLENYENQKFLKKIYTNINLWTKKIDRAELDITSKIKILFLIFLFLDIVLIYFYFKTNYFVLYGILFLLAQPLIVAIANIFLLPFDFGIKKTLIIRAQNKLKKYPNLIKIWITWSYGKTSQKEILTQVLSSKYKVLCTIWNENTPIGISRLILNKLDQSYDVLIVEMWAYKKWDIKELCKLVNPEIWILTGITKQHLERFWNLENIISAKLELFVNLKKWWTGYYDINSKESVIWIERIKTESKEIHLEEINWNIDFDYKPNFQWITFEYDNQKFETKLLAPHNILQIIIAYKIGLKLWISKQEITKAVNNLNYIANRLELIFNPSNWVYILDDSYNGNIKGIESTISMFEKINFAGKKVYLTPGLVELGAENEKIHLELWAKLWKTFDTYLLIQSPATQALSSWLLSAWVKKESIIFYDSTLLVHWDLKNILKKWDIIVFQNDWSENYFL